MEEWVKERVNWNLKKKKHDEMEMKMKMKSGKWESHENGMRAERDGWKGKSKYL